MRDRNGMFEFEGGWRRARGASCIVAQIAGGVVRDLIADPDLFYAPDVVATEGFDANGDYHFPEPPEAA